MLVADRKGDGKTNYFPLSLPRRNHRQESKGHIGNEEFILLISPGADLFGKPQVEENGAYSLHIHLDLRDHVLWDTTSRKQQSGSGNLCPTNGGCFTLQGRRYGFSIIGGAPRGIGDFTRHHRQLPAQDETLPCVLLLGTAKVQPRGKVGLCEFREQTTLQTKLIPKLDRSTIVSCPYTG